MVNVSFDAKERRNFQSCVLFVYDILRLCLNLYVQLLCIKSIYICVINIFIFICPLIMCPFRVFLLCIMREAILAVFVDEYSSVIGPSRVHFSYWQHSNRLEHGSASVCVCI